MKNIKQIITLILISFLLPFSLVACSDNSDDNNKLFVGVAIYQKQENNLNWAKFNAKPNAINNIISTEDNKIKLEDELEPLFFVYSINEIPSTIKDSDFISNTTRDKVKLNNNTLSFRLERIIEDTEILIYFIYKLESGDYYLEYKEIKTNISKSTEMFELSIINDNFSKINLTLETNLTINDEY